MNMSLNLRLENMLSREKKYDYSGINTFLYWGGLSSVTGLQLHEAASEMIWSKIGAEADASFFAPRYGVPVIHGGLLARPRRDLARFGLLFTPSHNVVNELPIITEKAY